MSSLLVLLVTLSFGGCITEADPPGHLQPLGSHADPILVDRTDAFPSARQFRRYVTEQRPLVVQGLLKETGCFRDWRYDNHLRAKFGAVEISIELGKKENRSQGQERISMSDFLDRYRTEDVYMVTDMPDEMKQDWPLPSFLLCGGYTDNLALINMWFSSGGTKSVLHTDEYENLHCVVTGRKEFVIFEPQHSERIGTEFQNLGYYRIDVDRVDMNTYPGLVDLPWHLAELDEGDCLYLPLGWIHHVRSFDRNLAVNVWWIPFEFRDWECDEHALGPGFASISHFRLRPELQIKSFLSRIARPDGTIHAEDVYKVQAERTAPGLTVGHVKKMFEVLVPGSNGVLDKALLAHNRIPLDRYRQVMELVGQLIQQLEQPPDLDPLDGNYGFSDNEHFGGQGEDDDEWVEHLEGGGDGHPHIRDEL